MTIRLTSTYQGNPPNTILTLAPAVEAALVAGKNATTDLSGGIPAVYVAPQQSIVAPKLLIGADGVPIGLVDSNGAVVSVFAGITAPGVPTGLALTAIAGGVLAAFTPSATVGGTATIGYEVTLSNGISQRGVGSPIMINSPAGQAVTATVKQINGYTTSAASAASNSATPTGVPIPAAPVLLTAASITGTPAVGTPLNITGATFSGAPTPTVSRVIRMDGTQVASGNTSTTYTPVAGDVGKIPSVTDTATNASGTAFSTVAGAAVVGAVVAATAFDPTVAYTSGTPVIYAGNRYVFNADHPAGNWIGSDATYQSYVSGVDTTWGNYKQLGDQFDFVSGSIATTVVTSPTTSFAGKLQVEAPWDKARMVALQKEGKYMRGHKFALASSESAAINTASAAYDVTVGGTATSTLYNASTAPNGFRQVPWGGQQASPIQGPGAVTTPSQGHVAIASYEFSDIIDSVSVAPVGSTRPFLVWRESRLQGIGDQRSDGRNNSLTKNYGKFSGGQVFGRLAINQVITNSGDMVADPTLAKTVALINPATAGTWSNVIFQLRHPVRLRNFIGVGDSITETYDWAIDSLLSVSTPSAPICYFNGGAEGDASAQYLAALKLYIRDPRFNFTDVLMPSFSPNELTNQTTATMAAYETAVMAAVDQCAARGLRVYVWTSYASLTPRFTGNGTAVAAIQAYNQRMRVRAAASDAPFKLIEIEQGWDQATMSTDGTHPNETGKTFFRSRVIPGIQRT